ncbi:MAG: DUF1189 family protein [Bacteroidota bacterium]
MSPMRRLWFSLRGVRHYPDLVADGLRGAVRYLLALVLVLTALRGIGQYREIGFVLQRSSQIVATWPDFSLAKGRFSFAGAMPYTIADKDLVVIVDTSGETAPDVLELYPGGSGVLLTATGFYFRGRGRQTAGGRWADLPFETTRDRLARLLPGLHWPIFALAVIWSLGAGVAAKALSLVVLALAGWLASGARELRFGQAATVAAHAMTGSILLAAAKDLCDIVAPGLIPGAKGGGPSGGYFGLIYWGLAIAWTVRAALAVKNARWASRPAAREEERKELELI